MTKHEALRLKNRENVSLQLQNKEDLSRSLRLIEGSVTDPSLRLKYLLSLWPSSRKAGKTYYIPPRTYHWRYVLINDVDTTMTSIRAWAYAVELEMDTQYTNSDRSQTRSITVGEYKKGPPSSFSFHRLLASRHYHSAFQRRSRRCLTLSFTNPLELALHPSRRSTSLGTVLNQAPPSPIYQLIHISPSTNGYLYCYKTSSGPCTSHSFALLPQTLTAQP